MARLSSAIISVLCLASVTLAAASGCSKSSDAPAAGDGGTSSTSGGTTSGGTSGTTSGGTSGTTSGGTSGTTTPPVPDVVDETNETMQFGGNARIYILAKPKSYDANKLYPLVLSFHGNPGNARGQADGLPFHAVSGSDAIIAYPQALSADGDAVSWDLDTKTADNADMPWIQPLIDDIKSKVNIDTTKILGFGYSGGAFFVSEFACRQVGPFKAIAINAGGNPDEPQMHYPKLDNGCVQCPSGPVPTFVSHGSADDQVPFETGQLAASCWAATNGCSDGTTPTTPAPCTVSNGCPPASPVKSCFIDGQGHDPWSGAMQQSWDFFKALP